MAHSNGVMWYEFNKGPFTKTGSGDRESIRDHTVPGAGNNGTPYTQGLENAPSYWTPEECSEGHLIETTTLQPAHSDPRRKETSESTPRPGLPRPSGFPTSASQSEVRGQAAPRVARSPCRSASGIGRASKMTANSTWALNEWGFTRPITMCSAGKGPRWEKPKLPYRHIKLFFFHFPFALLCAGKFHVSILHCLFLTILEVLLKGSVQFKHLTERKLTVGQDHVTQK